MAWWFDRPLLVLTRQWAGTAVKDYSDHIRRHEELIPPPIATAMQNIDTKATGLLTHVSMMIAVLGLVAPVVADHRIGRGIIDSGYAVNFMPSACERASSSPISSHRDAPGDAFLVGA